MQRLRKLKSWEVCTIIGTESGREKGKTLEKELTYLLIVVLSSEMLVWITNQARQERIPSNPFVFILHTENALEDPIAYSCIVCPWIRIGPKLRSIALAVINSGIFGTTWEEWGVLRNQRDVCI
jgi:hypothetical protein